MFNSEEKKINKRIMEVIRQTKPKARKEHICNWCLGKIEKGNVYQHSTNIHEGYMYNWKNHIHCLEVARKLKMFDWVDEGLDGETFREAISDEYGKLMSLYERQKYESTHFRIPSIEEQIKYVCIRHEIKLES